MIRYLLDTNICIYIIRQQPPVVFEHFAQHRRGEVAISAITWGELCHGLNTHDGEKELSALLGKLQAVPYDFNAAARYGELSRAYRDRKSGFDRMIAAHALSLDVTLVTNNIKDFELYQSHGLRLENWVE